MLELNDENFQKEVLESQRPVLVVFWRQGCPACLKMAPVAEEIFQEFAGRVKVGNLNVMENPEVAKRYKVPAVPTLIIFKDGQAVERAVGLRPKQVLSDKLNSLI